MIVQASLWAVFIGAVLLSAAFFLVESGLVANKLRPRVPVPRRRSVAPHTCGCDAETGRDRDGTPLS